MEEQPTLNAHNKEEYPPMHTAEHILNQTMIRLFGCSRSRNTHIEKKKSKADYFLPQEPSREEIAEIERLVNETIDRHLPVTASLCRRDELPPQIDLSKLPPEAGDTLRIVAVGDFCQQLRRFFLSKLRPKSAGSKSPPPTTKRDASAYGSSSNRPPKHHNICEF